MLENWLKPLPLDNIWSNYSSPWQLGSKTSFYTAGFELPAWHGFPVALVTCDAPEMTQLRDSLYSFKCFQDDFDFLDLGVLRKSNDSYILPLFEEIFNSGVFPILVTNDSSLNKSFMQALHNVQPNLHLTMIDDRFRCFPFQSASEFPYLDTFLSSLDETTERGHIIGVQSHLVPLSGFLYSEEKGVSLHRLGQAKQNLQELEPSIRHADLCIFEMSAIKYTDFPSQIPQSPSGFFLEEICQLSRYAGLSDTLKGFSISGFDFKNTNNQVDAQALAQIIWYLLDGFNNKKGDFPVNFDGMIEYLVEVKEHRELLTFWKSNRSGRWWVQVERANVSDSNIDLRLIPVSYQDYLEACEGELSTRVLKALVRYS